jgi:hypothetical protein
MDTRSQPLVNRLLALLPAQAVPLAFALAALLGLLLLPLAWALWQSDAAASPGLWRLAMAPPIIVFILAVHPRLQALWRRAIEELRPLSRQPELLDPTAASRRGEAVAALLGAALAVWISPSIPFAGGLFAYGLALNVVMFVLLALSIHEGLRRTAHLRRVVAAGLTLDLFDRQLLTPLARFGQGLSLTFVGGTCVSLLFQSAASLYTLQSLVIYSILIVAALTLFFTSVWSIHVALVAAQQRELATVRRHWSRSREALQRHLEQAGAEGSTADAVRLYDPLVVLDRKSVV